MLKNKLPFLVLIGIVMLYLSSEYAVSGQKTKKILSLGKSQVFETGLTKISNHEFYLTNYGLYGQSPSGGAAGWYWPRQSNRAYIYGAGPWFGSKKTIKSSTGADSVVKVVTVGYNPNSGAAWFTPGSVADGAAGLDDGDPRAANYILYRSVDYDATGKNVVDPSRPDWPVRWKNTSKTPGKDGYFGDYVANPAERAQYQAVFISQEDFFTVYKDTDVKRNPEYKPGSGYPNGIEIEQTVYSWGFSSYKDFVFFSYNVLNKSGDTLRDCYLAPAMDPDIGDAANDHNSFYFKNEGLNMAFQYTESEVGYGGVLGFDFLESPKIKTSEDSVKYFQSTGRVRRVGEQIGLTTFRNWTIDIDPSGANARYDFMAANVRDGDLSAGDKRLLFATGPFTMLPNDTARVVICIMIAPSIGALASGTPVENLPFLDSLVNLDIFAQGVYDNNFAAPKPPDPARVGGYGINNGIVVTWDTSSEASIDTLTGGADFYGYRLYRSRSSQGPWKKLLDTSMATAPPGTPASVWLPHKFIDIGADTTGGLVNNIDYYYFVSSFDQGDLSNNIPSLENTPVANVNVRKLIPEGPNAGNTVSFSAFNTAGNLGSFKNFRVEPTNQKRFDQLFSGHPLKLTLRPQNNATSYTLIADIKDSVGDYSTSITINPGLEVKPTTLTKDTVITAVYVSPQIFNAFRIKMDYSIIQRKDSLHYDTAMVTKGTSTVSPSRFFSPSAVPNENFGEADLLFDFKQGGVDTLTLSGDKVAVPYLTLVVTDKLSGLIFDTTKNATVNAPYGKWYNNTTVVRSKNGVRNFPPKLLATNKYYLRAVYGTSNQDTLFPVHEYSVLGWKFAVDPHNIGRLASVPPARQWADKPVVTNDITVGDQITVKFAGGIAGTMGAPAFPSPNVVLNAKASVQAPTKYTETHLKQIRVVPNPYFISHKAQVTTDVPRLFFNNLPPKCTIRIYNVAGDLIKVIEHTSGSSRAEWDLLSDGRQKVASQLLLAHIETPDGASTIVKFSVIVGGFRSIREN
ncbi:MAG: hypothetical protein AB1728_02090 [Bacteroidota bacterium]